jgi:hypothetical protein
VLAPPVSVPPKLGVTTAETEYMPIYLRIFFRVLSSWVHGEKSWSRSRLPVLSSSPPRSLETKPSPDVVGGHGGHRAP